MSVLEYEQPIQENADIEMLGTDLDLLGEDIVSELEMLGIDIEDPEMLGGWLKKLVRKIRDRVRARKKAKAESKARGELPPEPDYSLQTPRGTISAGTGGLSYSQPMSRTDGITSASPKMAINPMEAIQKNPMLLAIPASLAVLLIIGKKQRH